MSGFSELIKNFDKTRDYVRDFFIYGFKVRGEFDRKSSRTYDDEKRRVESWLGDDLKYETTERGKQVYISVDSGRISENPLYNAFYSKSFTDNDIRLHFLILDILSDGKSLNTKELTDLISEEYGAVFEEQTVRNKLTEYVSEGLIIKEKRGKSVFFSLSKDTADSFFGEYKGLDDAVKFSSESSEFGVVGNSLLKTAELENDIFLTKHNYIVHTLEDEILLKLTDAIENKRDVFLTIFGRKNAARETCGTPLKIYSSTQSGRRYLILYFTELKRLSSIRLDYIKSVKTGKVCDKYDKYSAMLKRADKKIFGVSFGDKHRKIKTEKISIRFTIDEENEPFVIERLEREKRCGSIEHIGDNTFVYTAEVFDANEMMTWIKSFIGRIVTIECDNKKITERFYSDISKMYEIYCVGEDEEK